MNINLQNQIMFQMMQNNINNNVIMMNAKKNYNIPPNQYYLVDEIIQFYQKNGLEYMNYCE